VYDLAKGRPSKIYDELNPFQPVDTPFRAGRAARVGAWAGGIICLAHLISVLFLLGGVPKYFILIGHNAAILITVQLLLALIAAGLARLMLARPTVRTASILLAWAILEALPFLTPHLYAHAALAYQGRALAILILAAAVTGLRGALALRKPAAQAEAPPIG
jgi:hypothetical protein